MSRCRFPEDRKVLINDLLDELVQEHRLRIVNLIASGVIRATSEELVFLLGFTQLDVEGLLQQFAEGKSFEDIAREQGYPDEDIAWAKSIVDEWFDGRPGPVMIGEVH
jgi:transcription initiation factor IIE alpha subunit